jgi:hypothetical protein
MRIAGRILAGLYAAAVLLAALFVLITEIALRHQQVEHLLPWFVLAFVTLPLSFILDPLSSAAPAFFDAPFVQLGFLTLCGAVQAALLWWLLVGWRQRSTLQASGAKRLPSS